MLTNIPWDMTIVICKNILLDLKNPKQLLIEFIMPIQLCIVIYFMNYQNDSIISLLFQAMFPFYIGNITSSLIRKFSVFFITEREEKFGMYQRVLGLSILGYFIGNLMYTYLFTTVIISPVWVVLMYYNFDWGLVYYFASFVICVNCFVLMLISFFKDPKVCSQVVGIICSLSVFLYYLVDLNDLRFSSYIIMMLPQPGFALSIIGDSAKAASLMLLSSKIYIAIYAWKQFEIHPLQKCKGWIKKYKKNRNSLNEQIQLESVDSEAKIMQPINYDKPKLLNIKNLSKQYPNNVTALKSMSLTIFQGQILALLGRNGAGKTTLIDLITKMQQPTSGSIQFTSDVEDTRIGVCYQQQILYQQLTVEQTVRYYIYVKRQKQTELQRVLKLVKLFDDRHKRVKQLSGGMKRRLSLSISIIGNSSILILDQPTSGLDPDSRRGVWQIINQLKAQQKSIIITTHHLDQAQTLSDRVCVIQRGKLLVIGSPLFIKKNFGVGYFLTIYSNERYVKEQEAIISKYVSLQKIEIDKNTNKYVLKMKDQQHISKIIEQLENIEGVQPSLQLNSLEQAFMRILNNPQLNQKIIDNTINIPLSKSEIGKRHELKAMLVKNILLIKNNPVKYLLLYNINILFLVIGIVMIKLFSRISTEAKDNPFNFEELMNEQMSKQINMIMKKVMLIQGYYFSIGVYIYNAVYEKQKCIINVLKVRGLSWVYYWIAQFIVDYSFYLVNLIFVLLIADEINFWFMAIFGLSVSVYSYCFSFLFKKSQKATKFFPLLNFIVGMFLPLINILSDSFFKQMLLSLFKYLYPFYTLQTQLTPIDISQPATYSTSPFFIQLIIFLLVLISIQTKIISRIKNKISRQRIDQAIKLKNVKKVYGKEEALNSLNLNVNNGEVLGLLGPNGAGKSTTFKILTNLEQPTSGQVYLQNHTHRSFDTTFNNSGVCYQEDTLWESLTGRQILVIFGYLVGIKDIQQQSLYLADRLQIQTLDRIFSKLSGGIKRKTCMAVCLMGQPMLTYLDQCSTGLDPMSRRSMVKAIQSYKYSTIVFTTHSMNQAQILCKKVAVLIKGKLKQCDTIKNLKDKYSPSYFVDILYIQSKQVIYHPNRIDDFQQIQGPGFDQILRQQNLQFTIKTHNKQQRKMKCSFAKSQTKLSQLFNKMRQLKSRRIIEDFSVYEPNLEDVYLIIIDQEQE